MKLMRGVAIVCVALVLGCDEETDPNPAAAPTTSPAEASATGATVDAAKRDTDRGARATGGLIDAPPATQPATP